MTTNDLRIELEALGRSTSEDFDAGVWGNWPTYVDNFNELLEEANKLGLSNLPPKIPHVPPGKLLAMRGVGGGAPAEKAKLSEVKNNCALLLRKILSILTKTAPQSTVSLIERMCLRFHSVVLSLKRRYNNRQTVTIQDEYDVQDLMRALLTVQFDDIRPEEWTPQYAGSAKRMDFLLKPENIVLELKKTRVGLGAKEVGDQLVIDIGHYKHHPSCKTLICFVYDPDHFVANPRGVEKDLTRQHDGLDVIVHILPAL